MEILKDIFIYFSFILWVGFWSYMCYEIGKNQDKLTANSRDEKHSEIIRHLNHISFVCDDYKNELKTILNKKL